MLTEGFVCRAGRWACILGFFRELPHSRAQESEADHIGLVCMARAGYDPKQAVAFWERFMKFNRQQGDSQSSFEIA